MWRKIMMEKTLYADPDVTVSWVAYTNLWCKQMKNWDLRQFLSLLVPTTCFMSEIF